MLIWLLQPEQPNLSGDNTYREHAAAYRKLNAGCQPTELNRLSTKERRVAANACTDRQSQHEQAADTLIASGRSADATEASALIAVQQTRIAAWGAALGFLTLCAAGGAAFFAERAAYHTKRSADIAAKVATDTDQALSIARDNADAATRLANTSEYTAKRQLRAYVGVTSMNLMTNPNLPNTIKLVVEYRNTGVTPAYSVGIGERITIRTGKHTEFTDVTISDDTVRGSLNMVQNMPAKREDNIDVANLNGYVAVLSGDFTLFIVGKIKYIDAFGDKQTTDFCCYWDGIAMSASPSGNRMT